tara:strand:- start:4506 stop:6608 length:2103 start_codon:yes stop_codon:yes gene_type:complete
VSTVVAGWPWWLGLALAVTAAAVTSSGSMGAAPSTIGLLGLALALLLVWCSATLLDRWGRGPSRILLAALALVSLAVVAGQAFLEPGLPRGHDISYHLWALWSTWRCVLDGDLLPRWNPYLGLGMPLLSFYSPLSYLAAWPAQLLGASPAQAIAWLMFAGQLLTAITTLAALRWLGASYSGAMLGVVVAMLAPYHLLNQNLRVALAETLAMSLLPLLFAASWQLGRRGRRSARWLLGLTGSALLLTHVLTAFMALLLCAGLFVLGVRAARVDRIGRTQRLVALSLCAVFSLGATAFWWLPVIAEVDHTSVDRLSRPGRAISPFAVTVREPVTRRAWERYGIRHKLSEVAEPGLVMPLYFGCGLLGLVVLAALAPPALRRSALPQLQASPSPRAFAVLALLALALAVWPVARLLDGLPLLGRIMFPWRLYGPASLCSALAIGLAFDRYFSSAPNRSRVLALGVSLLVLGWDSAPFLGAPARLPALSEDGVHQLYRGQAIKLDLPRGSFLRVERLQLPPVDYGFRIAKSYRVFPEYMAPPLRERYGKLSKPPSVATSQSYHASFRVRRGGAALQQLEPKPLVSLRLGRGGYRGLPEARWELSPERLELTLPPQSQAGNIRVAMAWFPGWMSRVDGGPWRRALRSRSLLAASIPAGAEHLEFRYFALRPWYRAVAMGLSVLTFSFLLFLLLREAWRWRIRSAL